MVRLCNRAARTFAAAGAAAEGMSARCAALARRADARKTRALLDARERDR